MYSYYLAHFVEPAAAGPATTTIYHHFRNLGVYGCFLLTFFWVL